VAPRAPLKVGVPPAVEAGVVHLRRQVAPRAPQEQNDMHMLNSNDQALFKRRVP